jgi:hypothetical protein
VAQEPLEGAVTNDAGGQTGRRPTRVGRALTTGATSHATAACRDKQAQVPSVTAVTEMNMVNGQHEERVDT